MPMEEFSPDSQPPPPPVTTEQAEEPRMSEVASLGNIFIEPGNTFEDMRRKPRLIMAGVIVLALFSLFQISFIQKLGFENIVRAKIEASPRTAQMSKDDRENLISKQSGPIVKAISIAIVPIIILIVFFLGGLLYWLGANAMGGSATYLRGVSVWVYSGLPPAVLFTIANLLVLFLKAPEDIDVVHSQGGLIQANPSFFVSITDHPVLAALLSTFDLFQIFGWILAAIGLQKVAKISAGAAWTVVVLIALIGVAFKVIGAYFFS